MPVRNALRMARAAISTDQRARYDARYDLLHRFAHRLGFRVYNKNLWWFSDERFLEIWSRFPQTDLDIRDRRYTLWSLARSVRHVPGDTAECGVNAGASSFLIAEATGATHHGFDSFEGLSAPKGIDAPADANARPWRRGDLAVGIDDVRANLGELDVHLYEGWIPARFGEVADRPFRLVHIDVDLYEPTLDSVEFFWPLMSPGGIIICDDYGFTTCPGATRAMDEHASAVDLSVISLPTGQGLLVKPT